MNPPATFAYVWEYRVRPGREAEFAHLYGPQGDWVALFRQADGYLHTRLLADRSDPRRFLTLDHWYSRRHYLAFRKTFAGQFAELDRRGNRLTLSESALGEFSLPAPETGPHQPASRGD